MIVRIARVKVGHCQALTAQKAQQETAGLFAFMRSILKARLPRSSSVLGHTKA